MAMSSSSLSFLRMSPLLTPSYSDLMIKSFAFSFLLSHSNSSATSISFDKLRGKSFSPFSMPLAYSISHSPLPPLLSPFSSPYRRTFSSPPSSSTPPSSVSSSYPHTNTSSSPSSSPSPAAAPIPIPIHTFIPSSLSPINMYKLLIGSIVPRPIAWVSTVSPLGITNIAPFSFFNGVSSVPPVISLSITSQGEGMDKDTLKNILSTKEFVVNIPQVGSAMEVNNTSSPIPYGQSEFTHFNIPSAPSHVVSPPRVSPSVSPIAFECKLYGEFQVGKRGTVGSSTVIFGEVVAFHVNDSVYSGDHKIDIHKLNPLSRLGGFSYGKTRETFDILRPKSDKPKKSEK